MDGRKIKFPYPENHNSGKSPAGKGRGKSRGEEKLERAGKTDLTPRCGLGFGFGVCFRVVGVHAWRLESWQT